MNIRKLLRRSTTTISLSIVIGLIVGAVVLSVAGYNPIEAYRALLMGIFSKPRYISQVIIRSTPIILTGLSVAFAFKTGLFNIGAEGQYIIGSIAALLVGRFIPLPFGIHFLACLIAGMIAAALYGAFSGLLKSRYGIHEVITCIMLNWIALYFNNFLVSQPWLKKPGAEASYEALSTSWSTILEEWKISTEGLAYLNKNPALKDVLLRTDVNIGIIVAIIAAVVVWFILKHTTLGFELRAVGFNITGAESAGIDVKKRLIQSMAISGALAGLAGALQISGTGMHRIIMLAVHEGFGFDGISVALIANSSPIGCIFSGLLFGGLKYGSTSIQVSINAPSEIINIVIGVIVFCIAMSTVFTMIADALERREKFKENNKLKKTKKVEEE